MTKLGGMLSFSITFGVRALEVGDALDACRVTNSRVKVNSSVRYGRYGVAT